MFHDAFNYTQAILPELGCGCLGSVLIIDDNFFNLTAARLVIEKNFGIRCEVSLSGLEALEMVKKKSKCLECVGYMLLLIDINMPVMTGIELIKQLRQLEVTEKLNLTKTYTIAYTALPATSLGDYKALGFNSYM